MNPTTPLILTGVISIPALAVANMGPRGPLEFGVYATLVICMAAAVKVLYDANREKDAKIVELVESSILAHAESVTALKENDERLSKILENSNKILYEMRRANENRN